MFKGSQQFIDMWQNSSRLTVECFGDPAVGSRPPQRTVRLTGLASCRLLHRESL